MSVANALENSWVTPVYLSLPDPTALLLPPSLPWPFSLIQPRLKLKSAELPSGQFPHAKLELHAGLLKLDPNKRFELENTNEVPYLRLVPHQPFLKV